MRSCFILQQKECRNYAALGVSQTPKVIYKVGDTPYTGPTYINQVDGTWIIRIMNSAGYELPSTGGPGTHLIYLLGIIFTSLAGTGLMMKRRRRNAA